MTERAADILHSICTEVKDADAGTELEGPVGDLEQSVRYIGICATI